MKTKYEMPFNLRSDGPTKRSASPEEISVMAQATMEGFAKAVTDEPKDESTGKR